MASPSVLQAAETVLQVIIKNYVTHKMTIVVGARTFLAELHAARRSTLRPASAESPLD
jgi:hypothetical protein